VSLNEAEFYVYPFPLIYLNYPDAALIMHFLKNNNYTAYR